MSESIHQFKVPTLEGDEQTLNQYEGKVLLIVNTASKCGFTPQLDGMEDLYREFRDQGLEILAFPSNDFAGQEPLEGEEIRTFCQTRYEASYPIFGKVHVKGSKAHELFQFLADKRQNGRVNGAPKWNFHKYLVDQNGKVVRSFLTITKPNSPRVKRAIKRLLNSSTD